MSRRHASSQPTYAQRVGQVGSLMDTLAETRLARVTRTARRLFDVQGALVMLWRGPRVVHQAVDAAPGLLPDEATLMKLGQEAVRAYAPRLTTIELGGSTRWVAAVPLSVERGLTGCLFLVDRRARVLDFDGMESLGDLGAWAEHELELIDMGQAMALRMA